MEKEKLPFTDWHALWGKSSELYLHNVPRLRKHRLSQIILIKLHKERQTNSSGTPEKKNPKSVSIEPLHHIFQLQKLPCLAFSLSPGRIYFPSQRKSTDAPGMVHSCGSDGHSVGHSAHKMTPSSSRHEQLVADSESCHL